MSEFSETLTRVRYKETDQMGIAQRRQMAIQAYRQSAGSSHGQHRAAVQVAAIDDPALFEETGRQAKEIVFGQLDLDKPLICRLNGHATGLGASLALLCDIVIAQVNAKIGDPHVPVGLVAGDGGALIWPQLVGYAKARHYLFTGELMTAAEAERIGLITKVVPEAELDAAVYGLAERLAALPRKALQWTKVVTNLPLKALFQAHFDAGVAYESMSNLTVDHQEAVAAFREKRKPVFAGR